MNGLMYRLTVYYGKWKLPNVVLMLSQEALSDLMDFYTNEDRPFDYCYLRSPEQVSSSPNVTMMHKFFLNDITSISIEPHPLQWRNEEGGSGFFLMTEVLTETAESSDLIPFRKRFV